MFDDMLIVSALEVSCHRDQDKWAERRLLHTPENWILLLLTSFKLCNDNDGSNKFNSRLDWIHSKHDIITSN